MKREEDGKVTLTTDEVRAGETTGRVRFVLVIGILLAVAGMGIAYLIWM